MTTELTSASETSPRPINQAAAVQAVLAAAQYHPCAPYFTEWAAFTEAVKENPAARQLLADLIWCTTSDEPEDDEPLRALGIGMVAGMLYAQLTGMKLPKLPEEAASEESQVA